MKKIRIISLLLVCIILLSAFVGCKKKVIVVYPDDDETFTPVPTDKASDPGEDISHVTQKAKLEFKSDGSYKVLMFGTLNAGVNEDTEISNLISKYIDAEQPDLVIFNGNIHDGTISTKEDLRKCLTWVTKKIVDNKIAWCTTFGVNTDDGGLSREDQMAVYEDFDYCVSSKGPSSAYGVSNFSLPILKNGSDKVGYVIYCLDSNGTLNEYKDGLESQILLKKKYGGKTNLQGVNYSQILWYWNTSLNYQTYNSGKKVPGLLCFQVPSYTFATIYRNETETSMTGTCANRSTMPELDSGVVWTAYERGDIKGIFAAYDEQNDYCGQYLKMYLGVTPTIRSSGLEATRGARVITLSDDGTVTTNMSYVKDLA